jgi:hypothetical protein
VKELIEEALQKLTIATEALKEIRDTQGRVCDNFELCNHKSCQSSYSSWAIANQALYKISE